MPVEAAVVHGWKQSQWNAPHAQEQLSKSVDQWFSVKFAQPPSIAGVEVERVHCYLLHEVLDVEKVAVLRGSGLLDGLVQTQAQIHAKWQLHPQYSEEDLLEEGSGYECRYRVEDHEQYDHAQARSHCSRR